MKPLIKYISPLLFSGLIFTSPISPLLKKALSDKIYRIKQHQVVAIPEKKLSSSLPFYSNVLIKLFTH